MRDSEQKGWGDKEHPPTYISLGIPREIPVIFRAPYVDYSRFASKERNVSNFQFQPGNVGLLHHRSPVATLDQWKSRVFYQHYVPNEQTTRKYNPKN